MLGGPPFGAFATCTPTRALRVGLLRIPGAGLFGAGLFGAGLLGSCPLGILTGGLGMGRLFGVGLPPARGLIGVGGRPGIDIAGNSVLEISVALKISIAGVRTGKLGFGRRIRRLRNVGHRGSLGSAVLSAIAERISGPSMVTSPAPMVTTTSPGLTVAATCPATEEKSGR